EQGAEHQRAIERMQDLITCDVGSVARLARLLELLVELGQSKAWRSLCLRPAALNPAAGGDAMLQRILQRLHEDLTDAPTEAEMAEECHQSPSGFSRLFKRHMGKSYSRYVNDMRIARVCE